MAAVTLVRQVAEEGREITAADLDSIRNICRCGTYFRYREAIKAGAEPSDQPREGSLMLSTEAW